MTQVWEYIKIALMNIRSNKGRSILTMLGIIIGIAAIITIVSTIQGTNEQIKENLIGAGNNVVTVNLNQSGYSYDMSWNSIPDGVRVITEETRQELKNISGVEEVSLYNSRNNSDFVYYQNTSFNGETYGIDMHYLSVYGYQVKSGRGFTQADYDNFRKVALVDADLRRSMVNSDYGLKYEDGRSDGKGLSHFLAGMVGMDEVIYQTDIPNAIMVPVGRDVPNPLALLTNSHFAELLDMLARMADYVIVDAPPVGVVIDAAEIAKACDGTLIAVNYNDVSRQELLDVKQQIEQTGCPILGTVLNQVDYDNYMGRKYYKSYSKYGKYGYYRKYYKRSHEAEKK